MEGRIGFPFPNVIFAEAQGAFPRRTSRATIGAARTLFHRSFRRKGGARDGGGREINYRLGPDRCLGAKDGSTQCEPWTAIGRKYDAELLEHG
jgi:hypothetical protein